IICEMTFVFISLFLLFLYLAHKTISLPFVILLLDAVFVFFFSSRRRHTRSVSAFLLNRSSDLVCPSQFATRRTLFHVLVGCGLLMLKVSRLKLPVIWLLVSMWLNTLTKSQIWTLLLKV